MPRFFAVRPLRPGRFYRAVTAPDPPLADFRSLAASGLRFKDPEMQRRAEEVSIWDSLARAMRIARKKPGYRFIATLEIPADIRLSPGKRGHWGIPSNVNPEDIKRWVVDAVEVRYELES